MVVPRAQTIPGVDPEAARVVLLWAEVEAGAAMLVGNQHFSVVPPLQEVEAEAEERPGFMQPPTPPPQTTSLPWPAAAGVVAGAGAIQTVGEVTPGVSRVVPPALRERIVAAAMTAVAAVEAVVAIRMVVPVVRYPVEPTPAATGDLRDLIL